MQDMSGFVMQDTTLPPLDEQIAFTNSTQAHNENYFYMQNSGLPSPVEFFLGDTSEGVISEDSDMFDNSNFNSLDCKTNEYLPESPAKRNPYDYMHSSNIRTTPDMGDEDKSFPLQKNPFCRPNAKWGTTAKKEPRYLAIIHSEEPLIKEDPDLLFCTQNKMDFDIKADVDVSDIFNTEEQSSNEDVGNMYSPTDFKDMGVAEEVIVMTEEEDNCKTSLTVPYLDPAPSDPEIELNTPEVKIKEEPEVVFQLDPFSGLENVMDNLFNDLDQIEDDLYSQIENDFSPIVSPEAIEEDLLIRHPLPNVNDQMSCSTKMLPQANTLLNSSTPQASSHTVPTSSHEKSSKPGQKHVPLKLDIDAARRALLLGKGVSDTPELLEALKPEIGKFDLIKFITTNGDPNNNAVSPTVESRKRKPEVPRKGKSRLSLLELKQAQKLERGKPLSRVEEEVESLPSTSGSSPSGRPARQSATRFKKMIEEGLLSVDVDSRSLSSDDEGEAPKTKRRRTTSTTSSRRRLNSDSDQSSVSEDAMKYRERRDRNNLSSKRSRQKRKMQHQMKQKELKELENENARLKLKAEELEALLTRVKGAWADHLAHMKDEDKD